MKRRALISLALFLTTTVGCTTWPGSGESPARPWTEGWRERARAVRSVGLNEEAREIERNLGVY